MKVIVIPHDFQEHYSIGFANGIAKKDINVHFICTDNMDTRLLHPRITWKNLRRNINSNIPICKKLFYFVFYHSRLISYVIARRGSIIHVIGLLRHTVITGIIEGLLFRMIAKKYILTVHDLLPHDQHTKINKIIFKLAYKIPHCLVVHTERMKKSLIGSFNIPAIKIIVMQHGLNDIVPDHRKERNECRTILNIPHGNCVLLFFGRLAPYKGLETLLEAFKELDEHFFLVIAGKPDKASYGQRIESSIASHPHRDRILCHIKFIENKDIATYFRAADALVMPYKYIDQSGVIFLAFRFGLPIVAFNVGAFNEYIKDAGGILIDGNRFEDLVAGINFFYQNRKQFSTYHIQKYAETYQWPNVLNPVVECYHI